MPIADFWTRPEISPTMEITTTKEMKITTQKDAPSDGFGFSLLEPFTLGAIDTFPSSQRQVAWGQNLNPNGEVRMFSKCEYDGQVPFVSDK